MFKLLKNFPKKDIFFVLLVIALICFQVFLDLKLPDYMSEITQLVNTEDPEVSEILFAGSKMLLCALGSMGAAMIVGYLVANISASFSMRLRKKLFSKVENLSMAEINKFSIASLITRTTNDITQVQMLIVMGLQMMIKAPITAVWAIVKILDKSWEWSAVTGAAVVVLLALVVTLMAIVIPKFKIIQKLTDKLNLIVRENLTGIRVVRAFNAEKYQERKFEKANNNLTNTQIFSQKALSIFSPIMFFIMQMVTVVIYFVGAYLIDGAGDQQEKLLLFSNMIVFSSYAMQVIMSFLMLAIVFMMVPRAQVSADRINEVLDTKISLKEGERNVVATTETGTVEFRNVSFKYPNAQEAIINDISFKAEKDRQ
ncbi:MAG: ABC transporter ATP-binding protein [Shewanella sp.]|nr:ABC transporter ATP-binding protein [Shewanella sp.]